MKKLIFKANVQKLNLNLFIIKKMAKRRLYTCI